jgi:hypothetical protein
MHRKIVAIWVSLAIMLGSILILDFPTDITTIVKGGTITVDDDGPADYPTIQAAIDAAIPGDTVYVYSGIYSEHVVVGKSIDLIGENRNTTNIDGGKSGTVLSITSSGVNVEGFQISNSSVLTSYAGIKITGASNCYVSNTNFVDNIHRSIWIGSCSYITIENCYSKTSEVGIYIYQSNNINVGNSTVRNCKGKNGSNGGTGGNGRDGAGIMVMESDEIDIVDNLIYNIHGGNGGDSSSDYVSGKRGSKGAGVFLQDSTNVHVVNNIIHDTHGGMGGDSGWLKRGAKGGIGYGLYSLRANYNNINNNLIYDIHGGTAGNATDSNWGGEGGIGMGIELWESDSNYISENNVSFITGGDGGYDSNGRWDGDGGDAIGIHFGKITNSSFISNYIWNITGRYGGSGNGFGGFGGTGSGIASYEAVSTSDFCFNNTFNSNKVINISGGRGGNSGGFGAEAGGGGRGYGFYLMSLNRSIISDCIIHNIKGGDGGNGGMGGAGGYGGNGVYATGIYYSHDNGILNQISNVSITNINGGIKGLGTESLPDGTDGIAKGLECYKSNIIFTNGTIEEVADYDLYLREGDIQMINSSFNKSTTYFSDTLSEINVKWFLNIIVVDPSYVPQPNANVWIRDNNNGTFDLNFTTGLDGFARWVLCSEYYQNSTDKVYFTPHNVTVTKDTVEKSVEPGIYFFTELTVILDIPNPYLFLNPGWNFISLPSIQSITDIQSVLDSIDGKYDAVQWYDTSDNSDKWKHNQINKISSWNDLGYLDHLLGFWIHVIEPSGVNYEYPGVEPSSNQTIQIHEGWNMVGYPSLANNNRTAGLNNLEFGVDVDVIQWFDAATKTWHFMGPDDSFVPGRGYWMHSRVDVSWEVPL